MQFWNNIIHTALLGTDKKPVSPDELGPDLGVIAEQIVRTEGSREEQLLQIAAVAMNYRRCGLAPFYKEGVGIPRAPGEEKSYCPPTAVQVLKDLLSIENNSLVGYWLRLCQSRRQLVIPDLLPALLQLGESRRALRPALLDCGGKRMQWLAGFNPDWKFAEAGTSSGLGLGTGSEARIELNEEVWQTGSPEQRRQVLRQLRKTDPDKAREWLQQTWAREDANSKADGLRQLSVGAGEADLPFLEGLAGDKSKKVKEETLVLLKMIPGSAIIQGYWKVLQRAIHRKKGKALLGLINKSTLQVSLPADIDESIFQSGIEKLSNIKTVTDEQYILAQLIAATPPQLWEAHFELSPREIVALFTQSKETEPLTEALAVAAGKWRDRNWAPVFVEDEGRFFPDLLPLLPVAEREKYLLRNFSAAPEVVIRWLTESEEEWSVGVSRLVLAYAANNPHTYNRAFFNQQIHLIPVAVRVELEKIVSPQVYLQSTWNHICDHISELLVLKQRTIKAFNE